MQSSIESLVNQCCPVAICHGQLKRQGSRFLVCNTCEMHISSTDKWLIICHDSAELYAEIAVKIEGNQSGEGF